MADRMTPLQRKALRVFEQQLERERASLGRISGLRGFLAEDRLKPLIELHSSNIRTYEKAVGDLRARPDRDGTGAV